MSSILGSLLGGSGSIIGIDIGLSQVKIAEVKKSGGSFKLVNYGFVDLPEGALLDENIQNPDAITNAIQMCLKKYRIESSNFCLGLFGENTVARKLQVSGGKDDEIEDAVLFEAEQYLPFSADDSVISFHKYGENEGGGVDILVAAARVDVMENYKELVESAGKKFKVKIVDLGIIAITNLFEHVLGDRVQELDKSYIFLDIGAQKTHFVIYRNGTIVFSKEIKQGGANITEQIQRQMGVNYQEAEYLKINGDGNGNLPEDIIDIIEDILEDFFTELRKTIDFYESSTSDDSITDIIITGGGAQTPGLAEGIETILERNVEILSPFETLAFDKKKFGQDVLNEISYRGGVALGLVVRAV